MPLNKETKPNQTKLFNIKDGAEIIVISKIFHNTKRKSIDILFPIIFVPSYSEE